MEKFIKKNWLWIMIVFAIFVMFGTISVKIETFDNQDNPWSTCPDTQNCSKGPITHQSDEIALDIERKQYLKKIEDLKTDVAKYEAEVATISTIGADNMGLNIELKNKIDKELKDALDQAKDALDQAKLWKTQAKLWKTADMNLDKKYQKVVKENTNIKNQLKQPVYARLSNKKYKNYYDSEIITLKECQDKCSKDNDCTAINYFTKPTGSCNVIKQLNYCDIVDAENGEDVSIYFRGFRDSTSDINQINLIKSSLPLTPVKTETTLVQQDSATAKAKLEREIEETKNIIARYEKMPFNIGLSIADKYKKRLNELETELKETF